MNTQNDIYLNMYTTLDKLLPGFGLRLDGEHWIATTGSTPCCKAEAKGHLYCYRNTPFGLKCHRCGEFTHLGNLVAVPSATVTPAPTPTVDDAVVQQRHGFLTAQLAYCHSHLMSDTPEAVNARVYLEQRGFTLSSPRMSNFGLFPDTTTLGYGFTQYSTHDLETGLPEYGNFQHRIVFGIRGGDGRVTGLCGRLWMSDETEESPKYLFSAGTDKSHPYALDDIDPTQPVLITEGLFTPEILIPRGIPNVVAVGGSKVSDKQASALKAKGVQTVILAMDWDPENHAGEDGTARSIDTLTRAGFNVFVIPPRWMVNLQDAPHKEDPDSFVVRYGAEAYQTLVRQAIDPEVFLIDRELYQANPSLPQDQDRVMRFTATVLSDRQPDPVVTSRVLNWLAQWAGMDLASVTARIKTTTETLKRERQCVEAQAGLTRAAALAASGNLNQVRQIITRLPLVDLGSADAAIPYFNATRFLYEVSRIPTEVVETGIPPLDERVQILPGELIIIAARVRHGKSSVAYNLMLNMITLNPSRTFILFSHEVPVHFVIGRMVPIWVYKHFQVELDSKADVIRNFNRKTDDGKTALPLTAIQAIGQFGAFGQMGRMIVVYEPRWNAEQIRQFVQRVQHDGRQIGGVFIDYVEMIPPLSMSDGREQQVGQTGHAIRLMANELSIPVFLLSQMNRDSREPTLEGLRYSGQLEQEAATVIGLYNEQAENPGRNELIAAGFKRDVDLSFRILKNRGGGQSEFVVPFFMKTGLIGMPNEKPKAG